MVYECVCVKYIEIKKNYEMKFGVFLLCVAAVVVVASGDPENCDHGQHQCKECEPLCLSNGNDVCYDDYLYLRKNGMLPPNVHIIGYGSCSDDYSLSCICCQDQPISYVCGSDNVTYRNLCELLCVSKTNYGKLLPLVLQYIGKCRGESRPGAE